MFYFQRKKIETENEIKMLTEENSEFKLEIHKLNYNLTKLEEENQNLKQDKASQAQKIEQQRIDIHKLELTNLKLQQKIAQLESEKSSTPVVSELDSRLSQLESIILVPCQDQTPFL